MESSYDLRVWYTKQTVHPIFPEFLLAANHFLLGGGGCDLGTSLT